MKNRLKLHIRYFIACFLLLCYAFACLLYFCTCVDRQTSIRMRERVNQILQLQCDAMRNTLTTEFSHLHMAAEFIARSARQTGSLFCTSNLQLLDSFHGNTPFARTMIVNEIGEGYSDAKTRVNISSRQYFSEIMEGKSVLTPPLNSSIDGDERAVLAVPIMQDGAAIGMLGGSYNLDQVGTLLFSQVYGGHARCFILDSQGNLISAGNDSPFTLSNIFSAFSDDSLSDITKEQMQADFLSGTGNTFSCTLGGQSYTMAYSPLGLSSWIVVFAVPQEYIDIEYSFVKQYERLLFEAYALGACCFFIYVFIITYRDRSHLSYQASIDALTGLSNRATAQEAISEILRTPENAHGAMFLIDLDHFKDVNDTYGHQMGDRLLQQIGSALRASFRSSDICCRLGGDEFLIFMRGDLPRALVEERAATLCRELPLLLKDELPDTPWGLCIGIAFTPENGISFSDLYHNADQALYAAKRAGRARTCFYDELPVSRPC